MMLEAVADILRRRATQGWLVGGTVRDRESGGRSPDLDLVVADDPAAVAREIAGRLESPWFALSTRHGAYRVMGPEGHVDVAGLRGTGILDDLAQRDFTVNAMAVPVGAADGASADASADASPGALGLVDPFGGRAHLREKRLVAVSDRIFMDDPLRLMRAVRFVPRPRPPSRSPVGGSAPFAGLGTRPGGARAGRYRDGPYLERRVLRGRVPAVGRAGSAGVRAARTGLGFGPARARAVAPGLDHC